MVFQLGSSLLDACVLSVLSQSDAYGYNLTQSIQEVIEISDSTMYPVLRRLKKEGLLITYDKPYQGRNRRYYQITPAGKEKHVFYVEQWDSFKKRVDKIMHGGVSVEQD